MFTCQRARGRDTARVLRLSWAALVAALAVCSLTATAGAQDGGVVVDPGSPTGKEYAIPLESQRRQADPSSGGAQSQRESVAPLFGAGIATAGGTAAQRDRAGSAPATPSGGGRASKKPRGRSAPAPADAPPAEPGTSAARAAIKAATQNPGAPSGGLGTPAVVGLSSAALLLLGGLGGLALRRTRR